MVVHLKRPRPLGGQGRRIGNLIEVFRKAIHQKNKSKKQTTKTKGWAGAQYKGHVCFLEHKQNNPKTTATKSLLQN